MYHTFNAGKKSVPANMSTIYLVLVLLVMDFPKLMRLLALNKILEDPNVISSNSSVITTQETSHGSH
jgi:hypothetical protein